MKARADTFYAIYNKADKCVAVYDNLDELVNSYLMCVKVTQGLTRRAFQVMCSTWGKKNGREQTKIVEGDVVYCSQKIYEYKTNGYSVYKFWEEEPSD